MPRPTARSEWIGTTHARRLLGVGSENTIKAGIGYGYLRGRRLLNGRTQVFLQDVLALRPSAATTHPRRNYAKVRKTTRNFASNTVTCGRPKPAR